MKFKIKGRNIIWWRDVNDEWGDLQNERVYLSVDWLLVPLDEEARQITGWYWENSQKKPYQRLLKKNSRWYGDDDDEKSIEKEVKILAEDIKRKIGNLLRSQKIAEKGIEFEIEE